MTLILPWNESLHQTRHATNPLADVLSLDSNYFELFGTGPEGFATFVEFFHLQDLASPESVRWLDGRADREWDFDQPPLFQTFDAYCEYLDNVGAFVAARSSRIRDWCDRQGRVAAVK